jgi:hypothetical protein
VLDRVVPLAINEKPTGLKPSVPGVATETPEFKNWFGESKVVDEKGKPLAVYHGTAAWEDFKSFEVGRGTTNTTQFGPEETRRWATFFTPDAEFTSQYNTGKSGRSRIIPAYLSIKNPIDLRRAADSIAFDVAAEKLSKQGINEKWLRNGTEHTWELFDGNSGRDLVNAAKRSGYDGFIFEERGIDGKFHTTYATLEPTQIKSKFNKGKFDPKNPDILYSLGPAAIAGDKDNEDQ